MKNFILVSILILITTSCSDDEYKQIKKGDFKHYGDTPMLHTFYKGTDQTFHYFVYSSGKTGGKWKLIKNDLQLNCTFPYDENSNRPIISYKNDQVKIHGC